MLAHGGGGGQVREVIVAGKLGGYVGAIGQAQGHGRVGREECGRVIIGRVGVGEARGYGGG